jgi:hypothetical protein
MNCAFVDYRTISIYLNVLLFTEAFLFVPEYILSLLPDDRRGQFEKECDYEFQDVKWYLSQL